MSVCLSACISEAAVGRISTKFDIGNLYEKSVEKIQIGLKSDSNIGHIAWRSKYILLFAGDIKWLLRCCLRVKCCQAVRIAEGV